ncbi:MAG: TetR/AcrR family transcriptional regulator [Terracidiphilus sp.]|nr:TetR/AcrR family transcriptional regulator [Terracidiphilus sp.]
MSKAQPASTIALAQPEQRRKLLEAALERIGETGPRALTMQAVARRAHLPLTVLEEHFSSQEDLYLAIIEEGVAQFAEVLESWVARGTGGLERFHLAACGYVDFAQSYPQYFEAIFELPKPLRDQRPSEPKGMNAFGVMLRVLEQAQSEGDLPAGDPMVIVFPQWSLVHGIAKLAANETLHMPRERLLELTRRSAEQLTCGIMAGKESPESSRSKVF